MRRLVRRFVIITVTATLVGFDKSLTRAAANMGANPVTTFFRVQMPLIVPGVVSGALFAFITSFDEVVVVLFLGSAGQKTLPWQMFTGLREQISPTILAVATLMVAISIVLLTVLEMLRRRSERLARTDAGLRNTWLKYRKPARFDPAGFFVSRFATQNVTCSRSKPEFSRLTCIASRPT